MNSQQLIGLALLATASIASTQSPADNPSAVPSALKPDASTVRQEESTTPTPPRAPAIGRCTTPIHTAPDDPDGGAYGIWGAGPDYKASFHDGFTFVPYLGPNYPHNQPWRWTTTAVTRNGVAVVELMAAPERRQQELRYEYDHGAFVEAYDLRLDGCEQTFVLETRPTGHGDLVVAGRVTTGLVAPDIDDQVVELAYGDADGLPILRYGKATAKDGSGRPYSIRPPSTPTNTA